MFINQILKKVMVVFTITFLVSCSSYQDIELVEVNGISVTEIESGGEASLIISAKINNPNSYKIKLKSSEINVKINGIDFGIVSLDKAIDLERKSISDNDFYLEVNVKDLLQQNFLQAASLLVANSIELELTGFVIISKQGIPFKFNIDHKETVATSDNWLNK